MDPRRNPYTPNAGARPPVLVGRDDQLQTFELLLGRLLDGLTEQSMIIMGLRGVGKTVLLGEFRERAQATAWVVVEIEISKHDDAEFRKDLAREARRALFQLAPFEKWKGKAKRAAAVLKSFTITANPDGSLTAGLDVERAVGVADSGMLDADVTDLFVALGEAARDHATGVVFLIDEIQFLTRAQLEAVIAALHKTVQRSLPITMVAAGLPQLAELAGEAKSYAERLFKFPLIGRLTVTDAYEALVEPATNNGANYEDDAAQFVIEYTQGYPYFLQEYGKAVWDIAEGPTVTLQDVLRSQAAVEDKLDGSFFKVRIERTTDLERAYLRAMAELGPDPQTANSVAVMMKRQSNQLGPTRARLIEKGLLYSTDRYGFAAFTVPQFDRYLKRCIPLDIPEPRTRKR